MLVKSCIKFVAENRLKTVQEINQLLYIIYIGFRYINYYKLLPTPGNS